MTLDDFNYNSGNGKRGTEQNVALKIGLRSYQPSGALVLTLKTSKVQTIQLRRVRLIKLRLQL
jgi:hypothetical protein